MVFAAMCDAVGDHPHHDLDYDDYTIDASDALAV